MDMTDLKLPVKPIQKNDCLTQKERDLFPKRMGLGNNVYQDWREDEFAEKRISEMEKRCNCVSGTHRKRKSKGK